MRGYFFSHTLISLLLVAFLMQLSRFSIVAFLTSSLAIFSFFIFAKSFFFGVVDLANTAEPSSEMVSSVVRNLFIVIPLCMIV